MIGRVFLFITQMGGVGFAPLKRLVWRRSYEWLATYDVPEWQVMNYGFTALPTAEPIVLEAAG